METNQIQLHEWQVKAWESEKRVVFFCAGVQSGKTTFGAVWILNEGQRRGPGEYIILAPTYKVLQQSTLTKFFEIAPRGYGVYNKSESVYRTVDGRTYFLRSADKPESIEGITAKAIWADEASMMKAETWVMMQGRVSRTGGRILCTFTPIALNWVHKEIERDKKQFKETGIRDIELIRFRSVDSPYFSNEEYERAKRILTPIKFQLRYEGIFGKAEGLIYPDFDNNVHVCEPFDIPDDWSRVGGIDWGYNNPFVALDAALSPDDVLYVYKERFEARCLLKDHMTHIDPNVTYYADPSGLQEQEEMRDLGADIVPADNDVAAGILRVNGRLRSLDDNPKSIRLKVFNTCINTIDEFSLYRFKEGQDKEILKEEPEKKDDHCMDALRYLIMGARGYESGRGIEVIAI